MKYICLGYYDKSKHNAMTEAEKQAMFDATNRKASEYATHFVLEKVAIQS